MVVNETYEGLTRVFSVVAKSLIPLFIVLFCVVLYYACKIMIYLYACYSDRRYCKRRFKNESIHQRSIKEREQTD